MVSKGGAVARIKNERVPSARPAVKTLGGVRCRERQAGLDGRSLAGVCRDEWDNDMFEQEDPVQ
jgi:hypothetical protein